MSPLENLGRLVLEKRGNRGIRAVAKEIGISHATLSRVERGHLPDLENYQKICNWLGINVPTTHMSKQPTTTSKASLSVHFRREKTITPESAQALAQLILSAQAYFDQSE